MPTWSTGTDTLGIVALLEETMYTTNWELETSLGGTRLGLSFTAGFATSRLARFA